ncbi:MAG: hypothetical protein H7240_11275 [Glaciimonas sp.]|nr:hypothetical protein [Glaciimonas sp.]
MQSQVLTPMIINSVTNGRASTKSAIDWHTKRDWNIDLIKTGERFVGQLQSIENKVVLSTTLAPNMDFCTGGGTSYIMLSDFISGGPVNDNFTLK